MESLNFNYSLLFIALVLIKVSSGNLTLSKKCGENDCKEYEYCDLYDHACRPCGRICDKTSNNFSEKRCVEECQDHIHDERYQRVQNATDAHIAQMYNSLQKDVWTLQILVGVSIFLTCITLGLLVVFFICFMKYFVNSNAKDEKSKSLELPTIYNNKYGSEASSPPSTKSISGNNNGNATPIKAEPTLTQRFRREPSESTLPEYAYDNTSLSPTTHHV